MDSDDIIKIDGFTDEIPGELAKKCEPRRAPRTEEETTYCDGNYTVLSRRYDEGEVVIELIQDDTIIKGYLHQLDEEDKTAFIASIDKHEKEDDLPFSLDLQVNVFHTLRKLKYAVILGEGSVRSRKHCKRISDILSR